MKGADITKMRLSKMAPEIVLSFYIVQFVNFSMFQHHTQFLEVCVPPRSSQLIGGEREEDVLEDMVKLPMVQPAHQVQLHLRKFYHLDWMEFAQNSLDWSGCRRGQMNPRCFTRAQCT